MRKILSPLFFMVFMFFLSACGGVQSETPMRNAQTEFPIITSSPIPISPEMSGITGKAITIYSGEPIPMSDTIIRLAKVIWDDNDRSNGTFILNGAFSPSAISSSDGTFVFMDLEPGDYVLVVGDVMQDHEIISEPSGAAIVWTAKKDELTDIGTVEVFLKP